MNPERETIKVHVKEIYANPNRLLKRHPQAESSAFTGELIPPDWNQKPRFREGEQFQRDGWIFVISRLEAQSMAFKPVGGLRPDQRLPLFTVSQHLPIKDYSFRVVVVLPDETTVEPVCAYERKRKRRGPRR